VFVLLAYTSINYSKTVAGFKLTIVCVAVSDRTAVYVRWVQTLTRPNEEPMCTRTGSVCLGDCNVSSVRLYVHTCKPL